MAKKGHGVLKPFGLHVEDSEGNFKFKASYSTAASARLHGLWAVGDFYITKDGKLYEGD